MTIASKADYEAARRFFTAHRSTPISGIASGAYIAPQIINANYDVIQIPTATAFGSGGAIPKNGDSGYIAFPKGVSNARLGETRWSEAAVSTFAPARIELVDVCWVASGFAGNTTSAQTVVGMPALTRPDANGTGLEMLIAHRTAFGSSNSSDVTVSYTNSAGVAGRSATIAVGALSQWTLSGVVMKLKLQAGDVGVQSVQSLTLGAAQTSAGDLWLMLYKPLAVLINGRESQQAKSDIFQTGMPKIDNDAALLLVGATFSSTSANLQGSMEILQE